MLNRAFCAFPFKSFSLSTSTTRRSNSYGNIIQSPRIAAVNLKQQLLHTLIVLPLQTSKIDDEGHNAGGGGGNFLGKYCKSNQSFLAHNATPFPVSLMSGYSKFHVSRNPISSELSFHTTTALRFQTANKSVMNAETDEIGFSELKEYAIEEVKMFRIWNFMGVDMTDDEEDEEVNTEEEDHEVNEDHENTDIEDGDTAQENPNSEITDDTNDNNQQVNDDENEDIDIDGDSDSDSDSYSDSDSDDEDEDIDIDGSDNDDDEDEGDGVVCDD